MAIRHDYGVISLLNKDKDDLQCPLRGHIGGRILFHVKHSSLNFLNILQCYHPY